MAKGRSSKSKPEAASQGATTGFEAEMWQMADTLRGSMDASEYKHVVLGLIFLKYVSDAFEERHAALLSEVEQGADPEDPDEYRAENIFGYRPRPAGMRSTPMHGSRILARPWMWLWKRSRRPTLR